MVDRSPDDRFGGAARPCVPRTPRVSSSAAPASTTCAASISTCRATASSSSPGCPARASPAWPSTRSSPRASAGTSSRCRAYARQFLGQMDKPDVDFIEGLSPGGLDRPEVHQPQPAVHGRHHHRGLRLPAAALRAGRRAALPGLRARDREADPAADRRPGARHGGGQPVPGAGAGGAHPQGRVRRPVLHAAGPGLLPRAGRRHGAPRSPTRPSSRSRRSTTSPWWSTGSRSRSRPSSGSPTRWRPRCGWPTGWSCSTSSTSPTTTRTASAASPSGWPARTATR